ncbi:hypothetical protein F5B21DRAFT_462399 [Xylaria acuta]|nr:hypothetical protein F5B21DRAFT_462399 [Xylaria acuta]
MTARSDSLTSSAASKGPTKSHVLDYLLPAINYIKGARREAWSDLSTRWAHGLFVSLIFGLVITLIVTLSYNLYVTKSACRPDGTFSVYDDYSRWDSTGFFQIDVAFGSLTFAQAKVIDIIWDAVVGRVGQSILAFLLWRSIASYAAVCMETKPTTYAVFFVLFLEDGPSFLSSYRLIRDFVRYGGLPSRFSTVWILLSMIFVLAWPTLIASMSGYTPEMDAYVQDVDGNFVQYTEFQLLNYIIHDGWRIGLNEDYPITATQSRNILLNKTNNDPLTSQDNEYCSDSGTDDTLNLCYLRHNISVYTSLFGFNGRNDTPSLWLNKTIPSPSLNIEAFYLAPQLYGNQTPIERPPAWTYANNTYELQKIELNGSCKPTGDIFKWGFSFWQLFIFLVLLLTWSVGTYLLWAKAQSILPPQDQAEQRRGLKALLLLAEITRGELGRHGIDPHSLTSKELKREIHKNLKGGSISFNLYLRDIKSPRRGLLKWVARELGWWLFIAGAIVSGVLVGRAFFVLAGLALLVYCIGSTKKSRFFLAACFIPASVAFYLI